LKWSFLTKLAFLVVLLASTASAYKIERVEFSGNKAIRSSELLAQLPATAGEYRTKSEVLLAVQDIQNSVLSLYRNLGFYYARIDSARLHAQQDSTIYVLKVSIHEGAKYRIGEITLNGVHQFSESELLARFDTRSGDVLQDAELREDIEEVLKLYEQRGYPFAKLSIASIILRLIDSTLGVLDIHLQLEEGTRARIGSIIIAGNTTTSENVIRRELRLIPGAYYSSDAIEHARARVERLGYFSNVADPELFLETDSTVAIKMAVTEGNSTTIDGILGYNPARNTSEKGFLSGLVTLAFGNISGTGRNAALNYVKEQNSSDLQVRYLEPWLFGYPFNAEVSFVQRQQDTSFVRTKAGGDLRWLLTEDVSVAGTVMFDRVVPTVIEGITPADFDSRTLTTGVTGQYDSRDNVLAPRKGLLANFSASYGRKTIYGPAVLMTSETPSAVGLRTLALNLGMFLPTFSERLIAAVGVHASSISTPGTSLETSDLFRLGGVRTIRGYREAELLASRFVYANAEYRVMVSRLGYLFAFLDGGYLIRDKIQSDSSEHAQQPLSYGLGTQLDSPLGILSVSLALAKGDPLDQAKIHLGVVKQF
jgi:outer membrane protein assembly complex protein YaeT